MYSGACPGDLGAPTSLPYCPGCMAGGREAVDDVPREFVVDVAVGLGEAARRFVEVATSQGWAALAVGPNRFRVIRKERRKATLGLTKRVETGEAVVLEERAGVKIRLTGETAAALNDVLRSALGRTPTKPAIAAQPIVVPDSADHVDLRSMLAPHVEGLRAGSARAQLLNGVGATSDVAAHSSAIDAASTVAVVRATLTLPDGRAIPVGAGLSIGRQPSTPPAPGQTVCVPVDDMSLSKTHLSVLPMPTGVWVIDHHSTNGTYVVVNGNSNQCAAGQKVAAPIGALVIAGELNLQVGQ